MSDEAGINSNKESGLSVARDRIENWLRDLERSLGRPLRKRITVGRLYLLLDCSVSMDSHEKMKQAKSGAKMFAYDAVDKGFSVGLITFGSTATHVCDPLTGIEQLERHIEGLVPRGSTNMAEAIRMGTECLGRSERLRVMVLVTDGIADNEMAAVEAATMAKSTGIEIIAMGTDDANHDFLASIASRSELARNVDSQRLSAGICQLAKLLPGG